MLVAVGVVVIDVGVGVLAFGVVVCVVGVDGVVVVLMVFHSPRRLLTFNTTKSDMVIYPLIVDPPSFSL